MRTSVELKRMKKVKSKRKWNTECLGVRGREFREQLEREVRRGGNKSVEERWNELKHTINKCAESTIGFRKRSAAKKPWVTEEMLCRMDERRKWKGVHSEEGLARYKQLHKELKKETEKARESWWKVQCDELDEMDKKGRLDLMYERVKILAKKRNAGSSGYAVKNTDGILLTDAEEVRERWREYTEKLYDKEGKPNVEEHRK